MTKFRLTGKKLFLTFAQCQGTKEDLLKFLYTKVSVVLYIIAKELHKDGGSHFHCYLELNKCCDIKNARFFDWNGFHPNFEIAKSPSAVQRYCKKDSDYITNMVFGTAERARELAKRGEIEDALRLIMEEQPREILNLERWKKGFKIVARLSSKSTILKSDFKFLRVAGIDKWDRTKKALVLWGPSCLGKTQYAKQLFKNPLFVRHTDKLKQFCSYKHDGIIFDDMNFSHWPRESCIHLLDLDEDADINVKCSMVTIPAGTPRVITTNNQPSDIFSAFDKAIRRRHVSIEISRDIRKISGAAMLFSSDNSHGSPDESPAPLYDFEGSDEEKPTPVTKRK